jgi:hypothetical protein
VGSGRKTGASQVEVGNRRAKTDKSRRAGVCVLTAIAVVLLISPAVTIPILFTLNAKLSSRQVIILRSALLYPSFQFSYQTNCTYVYQSYSQGAAYVTTAASTFSTTVNASVTPLVGVSPSLPREMSKPVAEPLSSEMSVRFLLRPVLNISPAQLYFTTSF